MQLAGECIVVFLGRISSIKESRSSMETGRPLQAEHGDNWHSEDQGLHFLAEFGVSDLVLLPNSCLDAAIRVTPHDAHTHHTLHRLR
jgi:hypothetical protein